MKALGGGSLHQNGWAFGCEFGFWQRSAGVEPIGLLRWASISPANLLRGLDAQFAGIEDPAALSMRDNPVPDWCVTQNTYGIYFDHTGMHRDAVPEATAKGRFAAILGRLAHKLIEDLTRAEHFFVYRTYDHEIDESTLAALATAVGRYGDATLLYVTRATGGRPALTARRVSRNLIVGHIDRFAPCDGRIDYNSEGWEAVCRSALDVG